MRQSPNSSTRIRTKSTFTAFFTGLRLVSSIAPTNLKYEKNTFERLISIKTIQNLAHLASARLF